MLTFGSIFFHDIKTIILYFYHIRSYKTFYSYINLVGVLEQNILESESLFLPGNPVAVFITEEDKATIHVSSNNSM